MTPQELLDESGQLFGKRSSLLSLWQEIADHFYPERADFTYTRSLGSEFADHLMTSYPPLVRRDLGNAISAMLRPKGKEWSHIRAVEEDRENNEAKRWLDWATETQRRAQYDIASQFVRATKEGDHDFVTFGQAVISVELNRARDGLLYRGWHLRDVAWRENAELKIDTVHRKWKPAAQMLADLFRTEGALHPKVQECLRSGGKKRFTEFNCRHIVMPADQYKDGEFRTPWVSIHLDADNQHIMEEIGLNHFMYVIPRWQTHSESQYAYSPATVIGLPDARLLQAMARVLLEAGEKATNPPMVATEEVVRSDVALYAGGLTWVDAEYDERLGQALRPITQNTNGIPLGLDMLADMRAQLAEAFYINKLGLPPMERETTAFEIGQRVQEWVRSAMPLFEPMESEYNGALQNATFDLLMSNGGFGSSQDIPDSLSGSNVEFRFESPLHASIEQAKGNEFIQARGLLEQAASIDPAAAVHFDVHTAFRDALASIGTDPDWIRGEENAARMIAEQQQQQQAAQMAQAAQQMASMQSAMPNG